jgi:ubiquitin-protein ligase
MKLKYKYITSTMNKRVLKELTKMYDQQSKRPLLENEYIVSMESTLDNIKVLVKLPLDSVYRHKFLRLDFEMPEDYPYSPPKVTFVNHDQVRIHPNMYENGKCCATILNTWGDNQFEKWTSSMNIESFIISFMSFFDNDPYSHEPGDKGDDSYTIYVLHQSWSSCLLKYIDNEEDDLFQDYLQQYLVANYYEILHYLQVLDQMYYPEFYFTKCFEIMWYPINYNKIITKIKRFYNKFKSIKTTEGIIETEGTEGTEGIGSSRDVCKKRKGNPSTQEQKCCICMDTHNLYDPIFFVTFECTHKFHRVCMKTHENICPVCRSILTDNDKALLGFKWKKKATTTITSRKRIRLD